MSSVVDTTRLVRQFRTTLCLALAACTHTTDFSLDAGENDGGVDGAIEEDAGAMLGISDAGRPLCGDGHVCACSNDQDDDGDMKPDGHDPECTGPFDDYEDSFRVNDVREGNPNKCADCFFDGNLGGDDGCSVSSLCKIDGKPGNNRGMCKKDDCTASAACLDHCLPATPNGCDCFGCCEVKSADVRIQLVATCRMDKIHDAEACPTCQINESCYNPCNVCDICPGQDFEDLPLTCNNAVSCSNAKSCERSSECAPSQYCGQGCCLPILY
jgi:hypothetical protein